RVGDEAEAIIQNVEVLAELDLALAKARFSYALHAIPAELSAGRWPVGGADTPLQPWEHPLHLIRARHPLLYADTVVPIDVYLGGDYTVLLITGPNTGGKTVSLKTVGLLAAMNQAGLHIPAADGSRLPVFDGLYADIGDEQSIEQSLSTFSSHMTHIIDILRRADAGSLILLDELGAGTDPVEGAALARALIRTFLERRSLLVCSSHYSDLKVFAFNTPGVQNGSVEFDVDSLAPTYRLTIGVPGRSNALAIAARLGLDRSLVAEAESYLSGDALHAEDMLAALKTAQEDAEATLRELEEARERVRKVERELRDQLADIDERRRQVLAGAREEGRRELEAFRSELRRLRTSLVDRGTAAEALRNVSATIERLEERLAAIEPAAPEEEPEHSLEIGDEVLVKTLGKTGQLLSRDGQEAEVAVGGFRLRTRVGALEFRSRPQPTTEREEDARVKAPEVASPGIELDLRGYRAEAVASVLDRYLDNAYLAGLPWVSIIHGKGAGVLRNVVREIVGRHPLVAKHRLGALSEGGDGVTVVELHKR
ncbi:MAG: endonuclease MutS2, partial [Chloroflexi bacterium]|nr:endonuclease MutS2 [Chloroflexota bacterium]